MGFTGVSYNPYNSPEINGITGVTPPKTNMEPNNGGLVQMTFLLKQVIFRFHVGVSKNSGTPKWMVKIMENPIKMDDLGGFTTPIFGNTHVSFLGV